MVRRGSQQTSPFCRKEVYMKGEENLIPFNKRAEDEQRAIARKGGQARGKQRREKKLLSEICNMIGNMDCKNSLTKGLPDDARTNDAAVAMAMYKAARNGDTKAATWIRDTKGESKVQVELAKAEPIDMSNLGFDE